MTDASEYSIEVRKGNFDGEVCYQARVKEIPYLEEYGDTFEEAYALVIDSLEATAAIMAKKGKTMPAPHLDTADYSGRVTLRIPKALHRYLSGCAETEEVSLNSFLSNILAAFRGFDSAHETQRSAWSRAGLLEAGGFEARDRRVSKRSTIRVVGGSSYTLDRVA